MKLWNCIAWIITIPIWGIGYLAYTCTIAPMGLCVRHLNNSKILVMVLKLLLFVLTPCLCITGFFNALCVLPRLLDRIQDFCDSSDPDWVALIAPEKRGKAVSMADDYIGRVFSC